LGGWDCKHEKTAAGLVLDVSGIVAMKPMFKV
jgi:hypothetical protein